MAPYLFLDIDGVLNPHKKEVPMPFDPGLNARLAKEKHDDGFLDLNIYFTNHVRYGFNADACARIKQLVDEFDLKIVLTSSWRLIYSRNDLRYLFKIWNMEDAFADCTPLGAPRHTVIQEYIKKHHIVNFLVIDDADMRRFFESRAICTRDHFTQEDYHMARTLLQNQ